jgi:ubiquinone/menaquinone biosynthesis C-methylase UbiE
MSTNDWSTLWRNAMKKDLVNVKANKDDLFKMAMSFQVSKALFLGNELDVFSLLSKKSAAVETLAKKLQLHPRPLGRLLNALVACGLLNKRNEKFSNTEIATAFLVKGKPEYFGDYLSIVNDVSETWGRYERVIRENHSLPLFQKDYPQASDTARVLDGRQLQLIRRVMLAQEAFSYRQAVALPAVYDFSKHSFLLDIGGGTGIFSIMAVQAQPHLKAIVFDMPAVCTVARERIKFYKAAKKITVQEGNLLTDDLPAEADVALISTVLDGYDEPECRMLLKKAFTVLKSKGVLIINEMMLNEERTGPLFPALFSLELMVERNTGDARTVGEIRQWMKDAGFVAITSKPLREKRETFLNCKIVVGKKP